VVVGEWNEASLMFSEGILDAFIEGDCNSVVNLTLFPLGDSWPGRRRRRG